MILWPVRTIEIRGGRGGWPSWDSGTRIPRLAREGG